MLNLIKEDYYFPFSKIFLNFYKPTYQVDESLLPALFTRNSTSVESQEVGELFTDQLVSWIKKDFVLGN